jgi:hypothetical protein
VAGHNRGSASNFSVIICQSKPTKNQNFNNDHYSTEQAYPASVANHQKQTGLVNGGDENTRLTP